ncbi:MAG: class I SAM-dependent methyltransferase [Legionella longbeachae]|nr:class I SAM-dependent methyltransferase [Legionella longbeachae]
MNINGDFFEKLYKKNPDPWGFSHVPYELYRYQRICDVIGHKKHKLIFEAGCSIGVLTKKLANLAYFVEAIDISRTATSLAKIRCSNLENVKINCLSLRDYSFIKPPDLIILSEIGYYFDAQEWEKILSRILESCSYPSYILASHWLGTSSDHLLTGEEVHSIMSSIKNLQKIHSETHTNFHLDYWIKK